MGTKGKSEQLGQVVGALYERWEQRQDRAALNELVELCSPELFAITCSILRGTSGADDVLQEAFWKLGRWTGRIQKDKAWAWLKTVTIRAARRECQRRGTQVPWELVFGQFHEAIDTNPSPLENLLMKEAGELLASVLRELPEQQRICLDLYLNKVEPKQAAATLGISVGTYRSNVCRAKMNLKKLMERRL